MQNEDKFSEDSEDEAAGYQEEEQKEDVMNFNEMN
jgi:hypothetical protein